ncbi:glycosyltransferase family 61 protein [bacterium]|nr:glycosyltransferase family 61 protein [bacterium]
MKKLYKLIITIIFYLIYGKIKKIIDRSKNQKISIINKDKKIYKIYSIFNCRIFTDTIHDTAFLYDNKIIKGVSFQLRKNINSNIKNNIVFIRGTPKILKKIQSPLLCILTGGAGNNNYWHWMYDALPRIGLVENKYKLKNFSKILVPDKSYKFQIETLKLLGIVNKSISSKYNKHIYSKHIIATNHPWQHSNSAHKDIGNVPKWISLWLKKKFLKFKSDKKFYKKIYIDRSDSKFSRLNQRQIVNEDEIKKILIKKKFKIVTLSKFSFIDQIAIFNSAKIIIGNHGAGFANLVFCKKNAKIIEFIDKNTSKPIKKISKDLNLKYFSLLGKRIGKNKYNQNNNLEIPINKLIKIIN